MTYHDYMKTVLSKDEFLAIFPQNASAEYVGDMFEFWVGMLELGVQIPTMFRNWGESLDNCLAGLEESFWLFSSSCRHGDASNTKRSRSKKAYVPQMENTVVAKALEEAGVFNLLDLERSAITGMPMMENSKTLLWRYHLMKRIRKMTNRHQRCVRLSMIKEQATLRLEIQMWTWMKSMPTKRDNLPR